MPLSTGIFKDVIERLIDSPYNEHPPLTNFINNDFVSSKTLMSSVNPATGLVWIQVPNSSIEDVDRAVAAANEAFSSWSTTSVQYRSKLLLKVADIIEKNSEKLAVLESRDQGKPVQLARIVEKIFIQIGVAGLICPWNLPLYLLSFKLAPALATGNTAVCKPSELTSVTAWILMHAFREAGFPPGVVNMVIGTGASVGQHLVEHPDVPLVSFTGSTAVGKKIAAICGRLNKKVSLEMGGKNAAIVYPSSKYRIFLFFFRSCFINQGEICLCSSRIFVHSSIYKNFLELFVKEAQKYTVGDPLTNVTLGAMNSETHFEKVKSYISLAQKEGGTILCGGGVTLNGELKNGYYIAPTIVIDLPDSSRCMQEEIFGPVVCVTVFHSMEEVVSRVNNSPYGLSATVWSENNQELINTANRLRVGTVWCNTWMTRDLNMPFGGTKESGMGREGADDSIHFFTERKTVCIAL
uniref:Aldehyde dehydrogenase family 8 member A1 n=1 Tax=Angiostrongylus cantonensis TaxID=6313 RepID=A0A0K0DP64_ANGCA